MIMSTDPLTAPLSRTALTYVLGAHPTWKASEIVAWEDQLSENFTEYTKYQLYINPQHVPETGLTFHNGTRRALSHGCVNAENARCSSTAELSSSGFPFSFEDADSSEDDSIFPCDVSLGFPKPCKGSISCAIADIPLCCGGLVSGSVSGGGSWDCADDLSSCEASLSISGGITIGIPNCEFCPSLLDFSVTYARTMGIQACCSGPFAYTKDTITLAATFLGIVETELSGTFYEMATKDENACKTSRPNYIQNANRKMVIAGKIDIALFFRFTILSGNIFMIPEDEPVPLKFALGSGDCCLRVNADESSKSCEYCPMKSNWYNWGRHIRGGRTVKKRCAKDGAHKCCR